MSTRCNVIIKDGCTKIILYRHSDGYPDCTGEDLKDFVKDYTNGSMRLDAMQSAGWLILRGHSEYTKEDGKSLTLKPDPKDRFSGWKCGAYEPTDQIHGDIEWLYTIDLEKQELTFKDVYEKRIKKKISFARPAKDLHDQIRG